MSNSKIKITIIYLLIIFTTQKSFSQAITNGWQNYQEFSLSDENQLSNIWGRTKSISGVYFKELLPAFFERKLLFQKADFKTSKLKWIFTGEQGGVTITISSDSVKLEQRYYDSFGFNEVRNGNLVAARYPQSLFATVGIRIKDESVKSITLQINHGLGLKLFVNDLLVAEQTTQLDLSKHQLQSDGLKINILGQLQIPEITESEIIINRNKKYQKILGFGGITSPVAYNLLSKEGKQNWWNYLKEYNLLIQREYPIGTRLKPDYTNWDNLEDATPHYYGDNFPNGEVSDFEYNKKIQEIGGLVVFEFWGFPKWMYEETITEDKKTIKTINYDKYADAMVNYCKTAKQKTGKAPAILGIQNEVKQTQEVWEQLTLHLRKKLDDSGFNEVKIHMHNANNLAGGVAALDAFSSKKEIWDNIDYTASNLYDYQSNFSNPDGFDPLIQNWNNTYNKNKQKDKPFLSVEMCVNDNKYQSGSYRVAFTMAELYHKNMVNLNAVSLMYCWLLVNNTQPSFSASRSLFTLDESNDNIPKPSSYQLRTFGSFSRHLQQGAERVEASTKDTNLLVSAFVKGTQQTIIILNRGISPKKINTTNFGNLLKMEVTSPYQENKTTLITENKNIIIPPGSILTLF